MQGKNHVPKKDLHLRAIPDLSLNHGFITYGRDIILNYRKEEIGRDYCTGNVKVHEVTADEEHFRLDRRNTDPEPSLRESKLIRDKQSPKQDWRK